MKINNINIKNFRNISDISILPDENMNIICGENAQGKTNIIEAIWLFSGAKSFRNNKDTVFIKFGEKNSLIECNFEFNGVSNEIKIKFEENKKIVFLNGEKLSSTACLAGNFGAVIFSPSDLSIVKDSPSVRRKFLDVSIGQLYPQYINFLNSYTKAIIQRNKIIKDYKFDSTLSVMLDVFEEEISNLGEKIIKYRKKYISILEKYVPDIYLGLSDGKENIKIKYISNFQDNLEEKLKESRKIDMLSGITSIGPHRDDIEFFINDINAKTFGSQGQQRSVALSLKLAGAEVSKEILGEYPVCLLDDVMSELDPKRQNYILNHIKNWQVFLSCCDPANTNGLNKGKIFNIYKGGIKI